MRGIVGSLFLLSICCVTLSAQAGKPEESPKPAKALVAHLADEVVVESEGVDEAGLPVTVVTTTKYYVVIEISEKALSSHMAHGDLDADGREKGDRFEVETVEEIPVVPEG